MEAGAEPFVDRSDVDGGFVADGQLVVPGGDGTVALEPADAAFSRVALFGVPVTMDPPAPLWRPVS
jgi:hypothetical protein